MNDEMVLDAIYQATKSGKLVWRQLEPEDGVEQQIPINRVEHDLAERDMVKSSHEKQHT
ncbi:MAG: hypothetical protein JWL77_1906 [Chthonomonadaceae bacterium]|nr:hypothetical protein [Chthonomonadaceae bacterium]